MGLKFDVKNWGMHVRMSPSCLIKDGEQDFSVRLKESSRADVF